MPSGVYQRGPSKAKRRTVRLLRPGEPPPPGEPRRYIGTDGYVILRWRVGTEEYVETREHRVVAAKTPGFHVHHRDHDRTNNEPSNLVELTPEEHAAHHAQERMKWPREEAAGLYRSGWTTTRLAALYGTTPGNISRGLRRFGVVMRSAAKPRTPFDLQRAVALHQQGHRATWIARALGSTKDVVRQRLREAGYEGHRPGRPTDEEIARAA